MKLKIDIHIVLIIVISLLCITATMTFITKKITANNVITFGNLEMQLIQTTLDENNKEKEVKNNEILDITYSPIVSRIVKMQNIGKQDFFARVSLEIIGTDANNKKFNANNLVSYNINTNDWIYKDGWYYYKKIVKQNDVTSNLMTQINFNTNKITADYPKSNFKFNIKAEVVQAKNNAVNVLNVVGWPSS